VAARGGVGRVVVGHVVGRHADADIDLLDLVGEGAGVVVVVAGAVGDCVPARRSSDLGVGAAEHQVALVDRPDGADAARGAVGGEVVGHDVGRHAAADIDLLDLVGEGAGGVVVVAGAVGEGVAVGEADGVGVGAAEHPV